MLHVHVHVRWGNKLAILTHYIYSVNNEYLSTVFTDEVILLSSIF